MNEVLDLHHPDNLENPDYSSYDEERLQQTIDYFNTVQNIQKIYCIGDCLTLGIDIDGCCNYPTFLQNFLGEEYQVISLGRSMLKLGNLINFSKFFIPESNSKKDIACVWCGTNDLHLGGNPNQIFTYLYDYCKLLEEKNISVIVLTVLPRGGAYYLFEENRTIFNQLVREGCKNVVDITEYKVLGAEGNNKNKLYYNKDGVHLNKNGYRLIALKIFKTIEKLK